MLNNFLLKQNLVKQNGTKNEPSLKSPNLQGFRLTPNSEEVMLFQTYALNSVQGVVGYRIIFYSSPAIHNVD